jgi:hypothetical protein
MISRPHDPQPPASRPRRRSPALAWILTLVLPGLGALYAGAAADAAVMIAAGVITWGLVAVAGPIPGAVLPFAVVLIASIARTEVLVRRANRAAGYRR